MRTSREERNRNRTNLRGILTVTAIILVLGGILSLFNGKKRTEAPLSEEELRQMSLAQKMDSLFRGWSQDYVEETVLSIDDIRVTPIPDAGVFTVSNYTVMEQEANNYQDLLRYAGYDQYRRKFQLTSVQKHLKEIKGEDTDAMLQKGLAKTKIEWLKKMQGKTVKQEVIDELQSLLQKKKDTMAVCGTIPGWECMMTVFYSDSTRNRISFVADERDSIAIMLFRELDGHEMEEEIALVNDMTEDIKEKADSLLSSVLQPQAVETTE